MHQHDHNTDSASRIGWAFLLNVCFTIIEFVGGALTNSTAIMADAIHDLGDSLSIGLAWVLSKLSDKEADSSYTYGYRRLSLMGALINGLVLIVGSIWVLSEAIPKLFQPEMPVVEGMLGLAILGVTVNGFAAYKLSHGKTLNEKVLNWHLLEDVFGWIAVLIVSIILLFFDLPILDPVLSILFTLFILINVAKNICSTLRLFLQASPDKFLSEKLKQKLLSMKHVREVHHLHLWSLDGEHHILTAHLVLNNDFDNANLGKVKRQIANQLEPYSFAHTTIEIEFHDELCRDRQGKTIKK